MIKSRGIEKMADIDPKKENEKNNDHNEADDFDDTLHELEMLYRSRVIDVPLSSNVKVVEIDKKKDDDSEKEE